jgi:hypothetical protein
MPSWKWDHEMGITSLLPILLSFATVCEQEDPEDESTSRYCPLLRRHINPSSEHTPGPMNYREAVWKFFRSSGTSVSFKVAPYEGQKKATTKSDAQDPVDKPMTATTRKRERNPPKVIREPRLSDAPVRYFTEPIFTSSGKIAAAVAPDVGKAPPPQRFDRWERCAAQDGHGCECATVCSETWFECNGLSVSVVSQHLKRKRAERKACIAVARTADMMENALLAEPLWLLVIHMISQALLSAASGIFNACRQRKWLARAVVIWMLVEATTASPIVAASVASPAPMPLAKFHTLKPPAAGHRRLLLKVVASNWEEMKTKCEAGDNEVTLGSSFDGSVYPGQIDFSDKTCVIIGQGQTLDAKSAGRFFSGVGAGSSLEVYGLVLKNGSYGTIWVVSGCVLVSTTFSTCC